MANVGIAVVAIAAITIVSAGQILAAEVVDPGKAEYHSSCAPCHGSDGKGAGPISAMLRCRLLRPFSPRRQRRFAIQCSRRSSTGGKR